MTGTLNALFAATVFFVGGHFLLSSAPLRAPVVKAAGFGGFRAIYSVIAVGAFVWMVFAYGDAPYEQIWTPPAAFRWIPVVLMPIAFVLAVTGVTTSSPTAVGGEAVLESTPEDQVPGILRITRHPFLWGAALWAASHLLVNGDAASIIMMGGILILSFGGMWHIDQRRQATLGSAWGPVAMTTSVVPFAALATGRTSMDWKGIGWLRPLAGVLAYAVFMHAHAWMFGASPLPM